MGVGIILLVLVLLVAVVLVGLLYGVFTGLWFRKTARDRDRVEGDRESGEPRPVHSHVSVGDEDGEDAGLSAN